MVTQHPRLNVVMESGLYAEIQKMAKKKGVSLSLMARDLLKDAVERHEDSYWEKVAKQRDKSFSKKDALVHKDVMTRRPTACITIRLSKVIFLVFLRILSGD